MVTREQQRLTRHIAQQIVPAHVAGVVIVLVSAFLPAAHAQMQDRAQRSGSSSSTSPDTASNSASGLRLSTPQSLGFTTATYSSGLSLQAGFAPTALGTDAALGLSTSPTAARPFVSTRLELGSGWSTWVGYSGAVLAGVGNGQGLYATPVDSATRSAFEQAQVSLGVESQYFGIAYSRPVATSVGGAWGVGGLQATGRLPLSAISSSLDRWSVGAKVAYAWSPDVNGASQTSTLLNLSAERRFGVAQDLRIGVSYTMAVGNQNTAMSRGFVVVNPDGTGIRAPSNTIALHLSKSF